MHDLWILLAWGGIIGGVMLNTFFHRSCLAYTENSDPTATCSTVWDFVLIFAAGVGAGLVFVDERVGLVGFLPAHLLGTVVFVSFLQVPVFLGVGDPVIADTILSRSLVLSIAYQFPFAVILSFVGCMIGTLLSGKLESVRRNAML